jgi:hypothetical protein
MWYSIYVNDTNIPATGDLVFTTLKHNFGVSCSIKLDTTLSEYTTAIFAIVGNQVRSKSLRSKAQLATKQKSPVLYRDTLAMDIPEYLTKVLNQTSLITDTKGLLLNDILFDTSAGDTEIKPLIRFERPDKTNKFYFGPGDAYKNLIEIIGLNLFSIDISIDEFIEEIITDISKQYILEIIPLLKINNTSKLEEDIVRYLRMVLYGI